MVTEGLGMRGFIKRSEVKMSMRLLITATSVANIGTQGVQETFCELRASGTNNIQWTI